MNIKGVFQQYFALVWAKISDYSIFSAFRANSTEFFGLQVLDKLRQRL